MTNTTAVANFIARVAELPDLPGINAVDMLRAQAWRPTASERADLVARADLLESIGASRTVSIPVHDAYSKALIGAIRYTA